MIETVRIVATPVARTMPLLREYYADIVGRYHGRPATSAEVERAMLDEPSHALRMLVARDGERVLGCVGLDFRVPPFAEVKRVYVVPAARGRGVALALLAEAERVARRHAAVTMRLDVRDDLVEARALYARCGYTETAPFNDDAYAGHWLAKDLGDLA